MKLVTIPSKIPPPPPGLADDTAHRGRMPAGRHGTVRYRDLPAAA
jgi:hypothetical protein